MASPNRSEQGVSWGSIVVREAERSDGSPGRGGFASGGLQLATGDAGWGLNGSLAWDSGSDAAVEKNCGMRGLSARAC